MEWMEAIRKSIQYTEEHITDDLTAYMIAEYVNISPFYFRNAVLVTHFVFGFLQEKQIDRYTTE